MIEDTFENRFHYDAQIFTSEEPTDEMLEGLKAVKGVSDVEIMSYMRTTLQGPNGEAETTICGIPENAVDVIIYDENRKEIAVPASGIILVNHLAEDLGIKTGDTVTINGQDLTVTGLCDQSLNWMNHVSESTMKQIGQIDQYSIFCTASDEKALIDHVSTWETYKYTNLKSTTKESNERQFKTYDIAVFILIGFAIRMGFFIVYNTTEMR